ncbi:hypothetical protein EG329_006051 [Mollisiaceae sp. DMI_Dod_QoI]|nr:hypothetical protein EG329_006051 [Helotiales sp. DMI_Dod_QoI]
MVPPDAKKQKTSESPKSPIIFESPGLKADLYFKVFDQEFHFSNTDFTLFKGNRDHEEKIFKKFLCALFRRDYQFTNAAELATLAELARYYVAIEAVSDSLYGVFMKSVNLTSFIMSDPCSVLVAAHILKNEILFQESLILALGPSSKPQYLQLKDATLFNVAASAYGVIALKIVQAQAMLLSAITDTSAYTSTIDHNIKAIGDVSKRSRFRVKGGAVVMLPAYYRQCCSAGLIGDAGENVKMCLAPILKNELKGCPGAIAGEGDFSDYFLCLSRADITMPWESANDNSK